MDTTSDVRYSELKDKHSIDDQKNETNNHSDLKIITLNEFELSASSRNMDDNPFKEDNSTEIGKPENSFNRIINQDISFSQPLKSNNRNKIEKALIIMVIILIIVNIMFSFVFLNNFFKRNHKENNDNNKHEKYSNLSNYCMTDECMIVAGTIYESLNHQQNPCDDFYEYACGGWLQKTLIPSGFPRWGTLTSITYRNRLVIKQQLTSDSTNLTEAEMKAKHFFKSCMDPTNKIESLGSKPLMDELNKFMHKDKNNELVFNRTFPKLLTHIQIKFGLNALFDFEILDDEKNVTFNNIEIMQGSLGLDKSYYMNQTSEINKKTMRIYKDTIVKVLELLFGHLNNSIGIMEDVIQLETRLAEIMYTSDQFSDVEKVYQRVSLADLNTKHAPFIDWIKFINEVFNAFGSPQIMNENDNVVIMGIDYFKKLTNVIDDYRKNPEKEKTLKMLVIFHLVRFSLPLLSKEYQDQFNELGMALTGSHQSERWQICVEQTDNIFGLGYAVARLFIRNTPNNSKNSAENLINTIKHSFIKNFVQIPWMNKETRVLAEDKVNHVDDLIGYPDFIENDKMLNDLYKDVKIIDDDYFGNEVNLIKHALKRQILTYRTKVNRKQWEMTPLAVNAYYSPTRNQIVFPNGILQEPFFHPEYPMYLNYGSIGSVMGHELTHGFDNSGREYDKSGMLNQWWDQKTIDNFNEASQCMVKQYSRFNISNEPVNGKLTLGENIADNGGLRASFNAYQNWEKIHGEEKPLPLLNLSTEQLFFVSFAQTWCTKTTQNSAHLSISTDQHSPPRFRVIGSLSNSDEFAKAFQCPAGSKMNPTKKCKLW